MSKFLPFEEALALARSLGLASRFEWQVWSSTEGMCPPNVPSHPERTYKDGGWQGWGHWLGTGNAGTGRMFLPFGEALAAARSLGLASQRAWYGWCAEGRRPPNVPTHPQRTYKGGGWQGWGHWLGTGNAKSGTKQRLPFGEALAAARSFGLANSREWAALCKNGGSPPNMPARPDNTYKGAGWQGWGHWLGTGKQSNKCKQEQFLPFDEALRAARSLRLAGEKDWRLWCRRGARPANVPAAPDQAYVHAGWMGWENWLYHADPDAGPAPAAPRSPPRASKRAAPASGAASGKARAKRRQR